MSWFIKLIGTRAGVRELVVAADSSLPVAVRIAILSTLDDITPNTLDGVRVEGWGHFGGGNSNIAKLEIENFALAIPVIPLPLAPPVDNAHVAEGCEKFTAPVPETNSPLASVPDTQKDTATSAPAGTN